MDVLHAVEDAAETILPPVTSVTYLKIPPGDTSCIYSQTGDIHSSTLFQLSGGCGCAMCGRHLVRVFNYELLWMSGCTNFVEKPVLRVRECSRHGGGGNGLAGAIRSQIQRPAVQKAMWRALLEIGGEVTSEVGSTLGDNAWERLVRMWLDADRRFQKEEGHMEEEERRV